MRIKWSREFTKPKCFNYSRVKLAVDSKIKKNAVLFVSSFHLLSHLLKIKQILPNSLHEL